MSEFLIEHKANVNIKDHLGWSVLHLAAEKGLIEIVDLLIKKGADPNYEF
jgi:ankyrin repeat protein